MSRFAVIVFCFVIVGSKAQVTVTSKGSSIYTNSNITIKGNLELQQSASKKAQIGWLSEKSIDITGDFINNSTSNLFLNDSGKVIFNGNVTQHISGDSIINFDKIVLQSASDTALVLNQNINIEDSLSLIDGDILLNGNMIYLGFSGTLHGENDTNYIFGDTGAIHATRLLSSPDIDDDIAGLGIYLGAIDNLGDVNISRSHRTLASTNGSILRNFQISPTSFGLTIDSIRIRYLTNELDNNLESDLAIWQYTKAPWRQLITTLDTINNIVASAPLTLDSIILTLSEVTCDSTPTVLLNATNNLCDGDSLLLNAGNPGAFYEWSQGAVTQQIYADTTDQYMVQVTNFHGCSTSDTSNVYLKPVPTSNFVADSVCEMLSTTFTNLSSIDSGTLNYFWNFGDTTITSDTSIIPSPSFVYDTFGSYEVVLVTTSEFSCTNQMAQSIIVHANPKSDFSYQYNCNDVGLLLEDSSVINDMSDLDYLWELGDGSQSTQQNPNHVYIDTGVYSINQVVTSEFGCVDSMQKQITLYPIPFIDFGEAIGTCIDSLILNAENPNTSYFWSDSSTDQTLTVNQDSTYWVQVTGQNNCTISDTVIVTLNEFIVPNLGPDTAHCGTYEVDAGFPGSTYSWSNGANTRYLNISNNGTYIVDVVDPNQCEGTDTVVVSILNVPIIDLGQDSVVCNHTSINIDAKNLGSTYNWSNGSTEQMITVSDSGVYHVVVTNVEGCSKEDSIKIYEQIYMANVGQDEYLLCSDGFLTLDGGDANKYWWVKDEDTLSDQKNYTINQLYGLFELIVESSLGCEAKDMFEVKETSDLIEARFLAISEAIEGDTIQFIQLSSPNPISWIWDFADGKTSSAESPAHSYDTSGVFDVMLAVSNEVCNDTVFKAITINAAKYSISDSSIDYTHFIEMLNFDVYPNPARDNLNVNFKLSNKTNVILKITNSTGASFFNQTLSGSDIKTNIDVSALPQGVYMVNLLADNFSVSKAIVLF